LNNGQVPMLVVGVVSEDRNRDFLPKNEYPETNSHYGGHFGNAGNFMGFISHELIPFVDSAYRSLPKCIAVGHSNGATFILYCLMNNPGIFDAYLAISPNWAFDRDQPVRRLQQMDTAKIHREKFVYMCNADEAKYWKDWVPARTKAITLLKSRKFAGKIYFVNQDFSATENHRSEFPIAFFNGIRKYLNYQYFNADRLIAYYSGLQEKKILVFTPDQLNQIAYDFYYDERLDDAIKILLWANRLFPENLNLYDSLGEMYQHKSNPSEALRYYRLFEARLEQQRYSMPDESYNQLKKAINERIGSVKEGK
jgi:tetratricopeptide (TPR) repeat protein